MQNLMDIILEPFIKFGCIWFVLFCMDGVFGNGDGSWNILGVFISLFSLTMMLAFVFTGWLAKHKVLHTAIFFVLLGGGLYPAILRFVNMKFKPISEMSGFVMFLVILACCFCFMCLANLFNIWCEARVAWCEEIDKQSKEIISEAVTSEPVRVYSVCGLNSEIYKFTDKDVADSFRESVEECKAAIEKKKADELKAEVENKTKPVKDIVIEDNNTEEKTDIALDNVLLNDVIYFGADEKGNKKRLKSKEEFDKWLADTKAKNKETIDKERDFRKKLDVLKSQSSFVNYLPLDISDITRIREEGALFSELFDHYPSDDEKEKAYVKVRMWLDPVTYVYEYFGKTVRLGDTICVWKDEEPVYSGTIIGWFKCKPEELFWPLSRYDKVEHDLHSVWHVHPKLLYGVNNRLPVKKPSVFDAKLFSKREMPNNALLLPRNGINDAGGNCHVSNIFNYNDGTDKDNNGVSICGQVELKDENLNSFQKYNTVHDYEDDRCVNVIFYTDSNEYSYKCDDESIGEGDFVRVRARGRIKTVKVTEVFYETAANYSSVIGLASKNEIDEVADRFDEFANVGDDCPSYSTGSGYSSYDNNTPTASYGAVSAFTWRRDKNEKEDYYERLRNNKSLTDERGYMRDGKAEELVYQLEKAKRIGRLTDDRGFIIDEDYVLTRRDHYDPDEEWKEDRDEEC